jgi:hypothetical protein
MLRVDSTGKPVPWAQARLCCRVVLCVSVMAGCASSTYGQSDTASIRGSVTDPTGAVVPDAAVRLLDIDRGLQLVTATDTGGRYTFTTVRPGRYDIEVEKTGFSLVRLTGITVNVLDRLEQHVKLEVGPVTADVRVGVSTLHLNTSDGTVSTVIDRDVIDNLPLNGRSVQTLIMMTPGVVVTPTAFDDQGQFSVNGQRADANYFTIDGVSANFGVTGYFPLVQAGGGALPALSVAGGTNSLVSADAMQEFRVQTSSFAPEFGRTPGGQISVVTRSGTNAFHGSAFEYFRAGALDANNWFANANDLEKPDERQHDFGGVLGGPLRRDKTFFFASYERLQLRQPATGQSVVPDLASRQQARGDLRPFLDAYPLPNGPPAGTGLARFNASYSNPSSLDAFSVRLDHAMSAKLHLFGRYNVSPSRLEQRGAPFTTPALSTVESLESSVHTLTTGVTQLINRALTHELRFNYSSQRVATTFAVDDLGGARPIPDSLLFPSGFGSQDSAFLYFIIGVGEYGHGYAGADRQRQVNLLDNVSWTAGHHQLKAGVDYRWLAPSSVPFAYRQFVAFSNVSSAPGGALSGTAIFVQPAAFQTNDLRSQNFALYGQDTWKVSPQLTVTYGVRWDVNPPLTGADAANDPLTVVGLDHPPTMTLAPRGTPLYHTTYGNIAPRVGLAYQCRATVLRAGVGTFYDLGYGSLGGTSAFFPYSASKTFTSVPFPLSPENAAAPTPTATPPVDQIIVAEPDLRLPRTYQWNAAAERTLGDSAVVSVTYVGAAGRDLLRVTNLFNPNPQFQVVSVTSNTAVSDYHALQVRFDRRVSRGLQAYGSYTWSHSVDTASTDAVGTYLNTPPSIADPSVDRADSDFDVRHAFSAGAIYAIPTIESGHSLRAVLDGWSLGAFLFARSAPPVDVVGAMSFVGGTILRYRPDVNPGVPLELFDSQYAGGKIFNPAAFTAAPPGQQGNFGRNVLRGFGAVQVDLAIQRRFPLTGKCGIRFRTEFFNILNHPNFGPPVSDLSSQLFGRSTQMLAGSLGPGGPNGGFNPLYQVGGPRSIQLALRLEF